MNDSYDYALGEKRRQRDMENVQRSMEMNLMKRKEEEMQRLAQQIKLEDANYQREMANMYDSQVADNKRKAQVEKEMRDAEERRIVDNARISLEREKEERRLKEQRFRDEFREDLRTK